MGTWLQQVAMGWLTYRLSGSVWLLGVVAFCGNVGILAFGTFAGVIADHVHRRRALFVTQSLMLLQAVVLAGLTWSGHIAVWHLVVLALVARPGPRLRCAAAPVPVGAPGRGPRGSAERGRAEFVPRQRRARDRPRARRAAARGRQRSGVLRAQRAVVRRGDRRDRPDALDARARTGAVGRRLLVEMGRGVSLRRRIRAGPRVAAAGRGRCRGRSPRIRR